MGSAGPLPDARTRSRETRFVAVTGVSVGIVAAVVLAALILSGSPASPSTGATGADVVHISAVQWNLGGFPCSGDPEISSTAGTTVAPGSEFVENDSLVNEATLGTCTFSSPALSPGFTLVGSSLPFTIDATGNATLTLTIEAPSTAWSGTLIVSVGVSTAF